MYLEMHNAHLDGGDQVLVQIQQLLFCFDWVFEKNDTMNNDFINSKN